MISIKSCNPFSRSECLAITEESCSFDSNIVFEFYCLLWLFAKLIKFLDYVLFLQVQTHFLEQYLRALSNMATKWKHNKKTEFLGVDYVANVINKSNSIFNKVDGSNDIGLDGYIEFIENESASGLCIGVQIKSGNSYQSENKESAIITSDLDHFEYWKSHILPLAGVVYIPEDDLAYW